MIKKKQRDKRALRVRKRLKGTSEKPRLSVITTNQHIYVQAIDDEKGHTLASSSTLLAEMKKEKHDRANKASAEAVGTHIAQLLLKKKINKVVFDRGSRRYGGLIAVLADAARKTGCQF